MVDGTEAFDIAGYPNNTVAGSYPFKAETRDFDQADAETFRKCLVNKDTTFNRLSCLPHLIEDPRRQCCLVLRQKASVMLLHEVGRILDRVACLLVGSGLLQDE